PKMNAPSRPKASRISCTVSSIPSEIAMTVSSGWRSLPMANSAAERCANTKETFTTLNSTNLFATSALTQLHLCQALRIGAGTRLVSTTPDPTACSIPAGETSSSVGTRSSPHTRQKFPEPSQPGTLMRFSRLEVAPPRLTRRHT
ncbi:hypothetical protein BD413DRAFT_538024, partial [Trametes elegans]